MPQPSRPQELMGIDAVRGQSDRLFYLALKLTSPSLKITL